MRRLSVRFSVIAASACMGLLLSAGATGTAHAATYVVPSTFASGYYWPAYYPTVYSPSAYYVPSAYIYPTELSSWSWPTTSLVATDYTIGYSTAAYYLPTEYTPYYTTTRLVPTYSVYPTVLDSCCVPAPVCCDVVVSGPAIRVAEPLPGSVVRGAVPLERAPQGEPSGPGGRRPVPLQREPQNGGTISSSVKSPPETPAAGKAQPQGKSESPESKKRSLESVPSREDTELEPAPPLDTQPKRRESMRPAYSSLQGILRGRIESDAGDIREGVRVTVASRNALGLAHSGVSDAFGTFAIRLEDGDWSVHVTMPSGRVYAVRNISVKAGKVTDTREGREIPNLIISY